MYLGIDYAAKLPDTSTVKADDVEGKLFEWVPKGLSLLSLASYATVLHPRHYPTSLFLCTQITSNPNPSSTAASPLMQIHSSQLVKR